VGDIQKYIVIDMCGAGVVVIYLFIRYAKVLKAEIINRYLNILCIFCIAELAALQRFALHC